MDTPDLVPGAGLVATGNDIGRFIRGLLVEDGPLSEATRRALLTPAGPYPGLRAYTTGLTEWRYENRSVLYHGGNGMGTSNRLTILPDEGVGFFTSVNGEAMVGMGDPSPQTMFMRDLHEMLVEKLSTAFDFEDGPIVRGSGHIVDARPGVYVPSRLDTGSILRLQALVSQFRVDGETDGTVFYEGPDGVTYATRGGTGSSRQAAWWETMTFNLALLAGSIVAVVTGSVIVARRTRGTVRWLTLLTGGLVTVFVVSLAFGMASVDVMDLFTHVPTPLHVAGFAMAGAIVSGATLLAVTVTRRPRISARAAVPSAAVVLAVAVLGAWSWVWQVLPV